MRTSGGCRVRHEAVEEPVGRSLGEVVQEHAVDEQSDIPARRGVDAPEVQPCRLDHEAPGEHRKQRRERRRLPPDVACAALLIERHDADVDEGGLSESQHATVGVENERKIGFHTKKVGLARRRPYDSPKPRRLHERAAESRGIGMQRARGLEARDGLLTDD